MKVVHYSVGGGYSDSPRALYEHLVATGHPAEQVWLAAPRRRHQFPPGTATVEFGSGQSIAELESADVVVASTHIELEWTKAPGATYLQTWHGTPLKHIHFDSLWAPPGRVADLTRDVRRWDHLLSPNRPSTEVLRGAFGFTGEVAETGYPRNDVLLGPHRDDIRAEVRRGLGIPDDATVVLYTPTWRDDVLDAQGRQDFSLQLDPDDFTRRLGPGHYLLVRTHFLVTAELPPIDGPRVRDVSAYPEVSHLYLAADAMVTDYSSTMFDFAVTGKPMLFFTYDLADYRDRLRGFYFDFTAQAPGPLLHTSAEVVDALADLPAVRARHAEAYARFRRTYCHLDDGHAAQRVAARFLRPPGLADRPAGAVPRPTSQAITNRASTARTSPGTRITSAGSR
ncbi:CDP-glycerol glycerophosphotransferase family protein [Actinoplanes sp. URMC 104]|uniref:CDP-glycerol glycerophosphotransferase family protein n=1 Tax=Actinoplanes sp. URMC 104 TaxID=3423409 RepID=UPI003F1AA3A3